MFVGLQVAEIMCEQKVIIEFTGRTHCYPNEPRKFRCCLPTTSFSQVRTH